MGQDTVQIAIEHHRAGRLKQAEAGYRAALEADPYNPDALHWLGVLIFQANRPDAAIPMLEAAAASRPKDPAFQHNLAQAYLHSKRLDEAIRAFERASTLDSNQPQTMMGLAMAHLARRSPQDVQSAIFFFKQAQLAGLDSADLHLHRGTALLLAGRADEAIESLAAALQKNAGLAQAHHALAAAYRLKGDLPQTRHCLASALLMEPENPQVWHALGILEAEAGRAEEAKMLLRGVIAMKPDYAPSYEALAQLLIAGGDEKQADTIRRECAAAVARKNEQPAPEEAIADLDQKLAPTEESEQGHYALAAYSRFAPPARAPDQTIVDLFDRYSDHFEEHLRGKLEYRVPEMIGKLVADMKPDRLLDVLDLGCGTGLCGSFLKPMASSLWGIDLSPLMIAKSKSRGIYDRLEIGDVVRVMQSMEQVFDLIVAGDVLIYIGDLTPVYDAVMRRLKPGGRFIASLEAANAGDRFQMSSKNLRYSHSRSYLERIAKIFGFVQESLSPITVRKETEKPVPGYLMVLRKP